MEDIFVVMGEGLLLNAAPGKSSPFQAGAAEDDVLTFAGEEMEDGNIEGTYLVKREIATLRPAKKPLNHRRVLHGSQNAAGVSE